MGAPKYAWPPMEVAFQHFDNDTPSIIILREYSRFRPDLERIGYERIQLPTATGETKPGWARAWTNMHELQLDFAAFLLEYTDNAHVLITIPFCSIISSYMAFVLFAHELTTINANITMDENAHCKLIRTVEMICYPMEKRIFIHTARFPE